MSLLFLGALENLGLVADAVARLYVPPKLTANSGSFGLFKHCMSNSSQPTTSLTAKDFTTYLSDVRERVVPGEALYSCENVFCKVHVVATRESGDT